MLIDQNVLRNNAMPDQSYNMTEHASSAKITLSQDSELKEINAVDNVDNAYLVLENTYC